MHGVLSQNAIRIAGSTTGPLKRHRIVVPVHTYYKLTEEQFLANVETHNFLLASLVVIKQIMDTLLMLGLVRPDVERLSTKWG